MAVETYTIRVERPPGVSVQEMKQYLRESVECWKRGLHPDEPIQDAEVYSVSRMRVETTNAKGK